MNTVDRLSSPAAETLLRSQPQNFWAPLDAYAYLRITGADAETFLQGQLSSDVRLLGPTLAQATSHSSAKGRVLFVGTLLRPQAEAFLLELRREMLTRATKRLRLFVLRAKVSVDSLDGQIGAIGLVGPAATTALEAAGLPAPQPVWSVAEHGNCLVLRRPGEMPRYSVHGAPATLDSLRPALAATLSQGTEEDWRRAEILAGMPAVLPQTEEHFVAQMLNLDLLGGIGFSKGCYTGQEVIARLHYLGKLKRRMQLSICPVRPEPGQAVLSLGGDGQAVGEIVDSVPLPSGAYAALTVLQIAAAKGLLHLAGDESAVLQVIDAASVD